MTTNTYAQEGEMQSIWISTVYNLDGASLDRLYYNLGLLEVRQYIIYIVMEM